MLNNRMSHYECNSIIFREMKKSRYPPTRSHLPFFSIYLARCPRIARYLPEGNDYAIKVSIFSKLTLNSTFRIAALTENRSPLWSGRYDSTKYGFRNTSKRLLK